LIKQKEKVEQMQLRKLAAKRELEGIEWSGKLLEERTEEFKPIKIHH
jgi:hypothetical protein